jgi:hypothetical protein
VKRALHEVVEKTDLAFEFSMERSKYQLYKYTICVRFKMSEEMIEQKRKADMQDMVNIFNEILYRDMLTYYRMMIGGNSLESKPSDFQAWLYSEHSRDDKERIYMLASTKAFGPVKRHGSELQRLREFEVFYQRLLKERRFLGTSSRKDAEAATTDMIETVEEIKRDKKINLCRTY